MSASTSCRSCGAALASGADRCGLCGTPAGETDALAPEATGDVSTSASVPAAASGVIAPSDAHLVCPTCAHVNTPAARFCNQCATALEEAMTAYTPAKPAAPEAASGERPPSDVGKRAVTFVGAAIAAVVGLYALTAFFGDRGATLEPEPNTEAVPATLGGATPIPDGPVPPLADAERQQQADAFEQQSTAEGLYEAGRYYLTDAYGVAPESPENSVRWAREAARLFEASLDLEDTDRSRLALAEALRVDPQRSAETAMRPVQEVQTVLLRNPNNISALYILGELRLERSQFDPTWRDSARVSFERVVELAEPTDPARLQAIDRLAQLSGSTPAGSAGLQ